MSDVATVTPQDKEKASKLYERARKVADASQWDYAIDLFLSGLEHDPDNVAVQTELRKISLPRKATGGKPLGGLSAMKLKRQSKDAKQNFFNALKLLSHDPGNVSHMELVVKNAAKLELEEVVRWMGPMYYSELMAQPKQSADPYLALKDIYKSVGEYELAGNALARAAALRPEDGQLQHESRELAAQMTMRKGNYDRRGGNFRDSVKNADEQTKLLRQDADVRTVDAMQQRILDAKKEYEAEPGVDGKILKYADLLAKTGKLEYENEALSVLNQSYDKSKNYRWKLMAGEIELRQFARGERMLEKMAEGDDANAKKELADFRKERAEKELAHFQGAIKAYPTEARYKFEAAKRLFQLDRHEEAIPLLQQSQNDAKYRDDSRLILGRSFLRAEFVDEAADTLRNLIDGYRVEGDDKAKEMYYWFGRSLEEKGDIDDALKAYSQIAQWDFGYRDVQRRIKALRGKN